MHPAEVNEALGIAHARCQKLIEDAEKRGDQAGADAWLIALRSIEAAEKAMREAREKQNWERKDIARPADTCWFCGSATLQSLCPGRNTGPCKPGKPERYQMQTCDLGTHGCPGRGEKHACFVVRR